MTDDELTTRIMFVVNRKQRIRESILTTVSTSGPLHVADLARQVKDSVYDTSGWNYDRFTGELGGLVRSHEVEHVDMDRYRAVTPEAGLSA